MRTSGAFDSRSTAFIGGSVSRDSTLEMSLVQALIGFTGPHEFVMRPNGGDVPSFHDNDSVSDFERIEPMRDDKRRAVAHELAKCLMDQRFAFSIALAGEFIQNQNGGIAQNRSR